MPVFSLFPTRVYTAKLQPSGWAAFNTRLLRECEIYRADDVAGACVFLASALSSYCTGITLDVNGGMLIH